MAQMAQSQNKAKVKKGPVKLIENDKGNVLYKCINQGYTFFMWVKKTTGRILWIGSCCAFMWLMPMGFEMLAE